MIIGYPAKHGIGTEFQVGRIGFRVNAKSRLYRYSRLRYFYRTNPLNSSVEPIC
ncbi:hypothetical protein [Paenibacillus pabuli]|uniref:hypothetical protein n=1 Tax=Paenibacillus pabuli TaxID=1472 RepID=UPI0014316A99|nr:hypothetical protein [Paenibacillus pabuli]